MKTYFILLSFILISSCSVEPKDINYGDDHCNFCDMTVVDKIHSSEYVTKKGKAYIFDAIECMVQEINQKKNEEKLKFLLVANYNKPSKLIDATKATYLISDKIKSPMGANLSAFSSIDEAKIIQNKFGGKLYKWSQLKTKLSK